VKASPLAAWRDERRRLLRLRLARPKANLVDAAMIAAFEAALDRELGRADLLGMLIDAEGPHFSFGASVEEHLPERCAAMLASLHGLVLRLLASPVPVLVAVRGQCLGGGLEVALAGTLVFAAPDAKLGQPEIKLGLFPPAASCLLPELIGRQRADELLLSGRSVAADEALTLGLITAVVEDPEAAALAWFDRELADKSASAVHLAMRAARCDFVDRIRAKLARLEQLYLADLMSTHDALEGLDAFIAKRPARWEHGQP